MEELEKIIKGNIDFFNSEEPDAGHFERFQKKLQKSGKKEKITLTYFLKVAVIVLFVSVSSILTYEVVIKSNNSDKITTSVITTNDYPEVDFYYTSLLNSKYDELKSLDLNDSIQKQMLLQELTNVDSLYLTLKQDLEKNPNDERIISAMIEHYQIKLEIMNQIITNLKQIENINNEKETNYESTEI